MLRNEEKGQGIIAPVFYYGFSQLSMLEFFVFRKTETCETNNHPLCGCASIVIQKITFPL